MKRSSMVLLIQDMIQERFGFEEAPPFLADELLKLVEEAGMEPPYTGNGFEQGNYWEPEHE